MEPVYYPQPLAAFSPSVDWNTAMDPMYYYPQPLPVSAQPIDWNGIIQHLIQTDPHAAEVFTKIGATALMGDIGYRLTKSPWGAIGGGLLGFWMASSAYR